MNQKGMKIAACAIAGAIVFSGLGFQSGAAGVSAVLPVAGLALVLGEGTSVSQIKEDTKLSKAAAPLAENVLKNIASADVLTAETVISTPTITIEEQSTATTAAVSVQQIAEKTNPEASVIPEVNLEVSGSQNESNALADETETISGNEVAVETVSENQLTEEEKEFSSLVIARVNDYVNVRDRASEEGEVVGKLYDKSVGTFLSEENDWYQIQSGNVTGFVKAEYVVTGEEAIQLAKEVGVRIATVTTTTLKVREAPGMDATVLGLVPIEDQLSVLEEMDGWIKVSIEEGEGYVSQEYVSLSTEFVEAESKAEEEARLKAEEEARKAATAAAQEAVSKSTQSTQATSESAPQAAPVSSGGSGAGSAVANYALQFVGNPYVYGGTSLTNGTDCSGFVLSVYSNYGISLPRSSGAQRSTGYDVGGLANAQPGDIVCYSGHVGIYIGNGNIVHASTAATGIKVSNASYRNVLSVRRIF